MSRIATLANAMGMDGQPPSDADMEKIAQIVRDVMGIIFVLEVNIHNGFVIKGVRWSHIFM